MKAGLTTAILLLAPALAFPHRLDEYLLATLISIEKNRLQAELTLTPGIAILPFVTAAIDADGDGVISETEQHAYAARVLRELSLTLDGHPLTPQLRSIRFPQITDLKQGLGGIRTEFQADLPRGGAARRLVFENRHQPRLGAYLVNCLVPRDPDIQIVAQKRNYSQSLYQLDYVQAGVTADTPASAWWSPDRAWLAAVALLMLGRFAWLWRQRFQFPTCDTSERTRALRDN
jgi:hypothetical protein